MTSPSSCTCALCRAEDDPQVAQYHASLRAVVATLNEKQRRLVAGLEAMRLGYGGVRLVAQITGLDEKTVRRGRNELSTNFGEVAVRRKGAGRKPVEKKALRHPLVVAVGG